MLLQALTHSSYSNEQKILKQKNYERLEFLGDAVLELVSSQFLFEEMPDKTEGDLTKMRSSLVCEPSLAFCANELELGDYIRLGKGEEATGGRNRITSYNVCYTKLLRKTNEEDDHGPRPDAGSQRLFHAGG